MKNKLIKLINSISLITQFRLGYDSAEWGHYYKGYSFIEECKKATIAHGLGTLAAYINWNYIMPVRHKFRVSLLNKIICLGWKSFKGLCYYVYSGNIHKLTRANVKGYFQGLSRMHDSHHSNGKKAIDHIEQQFYYRITKMDSQCIQNGMCPCQCEVPAKQWEDRACEKNCYPPMMNATEWHKFCFDKSKEGEHPASIKETIPKAMKRLYVDHK